METIPWLVLRTKSRQEKKVETKLKHKEINAFLPIYLNKKKERIKALEYPLFPGYIFVQPHPHQIQHLRFIPGSCGLLLTGNEPAILPEKDLNGIRIMSSSGVPLTLNSEFVPGKRVEVHSGALKGTQGELIRVKNQQRLIINIPLLGKSVNVEIKMEDVKVL